MRQEPSVNALHVEGMGAFGEQSEVILSLKLTQTDSTIKRGFQSNDGFVVEDREGVYEGLVNPCIMEAEQLLQLSLENCYTLQVL